ncbi:MAG: hypothetical protein FJ149_02445 [Euryarchaeota archaeon]|nr:hypothetical protein [Euryarchaeota archaeon]
MSVPGRPETLEASRCTACGRHSLPPGPRCPHCGAGTRLVEVGRGGRVLSWTTVHVTPEGVPAPRTVALVGLDCGAAVLCLVEGGRVPEMAGRVEVRFADGVHRIG